MKTQILLLTFLCSAFLSFSQRSGDLVFFSNTGEKFYVVLNGIKQNPTPETNVKVDGLTENYYSCKILSGTSKFDIDKNVRVKMDTLITYHIIEKKGKYKLRFYSEKPFDNSADPNQTVVTYHATENVNNQNSGTSNTGNVNVNSNQNTNTNTTNSTTTTTTTNGGNTGNTETVTFGMGVVNTSTGTENTGNSENIEIKINTGQTGGNINSGVQINENNVNSTSTTTTTTMSSSSTTVNGATTSETSYEESSTTVVNGGVTENTYSSGTSTSNGAVNTGNTNISQNNNGGAVGTNTMNTSTTGGCYSAMNSTDFAAAKKSVAAKSFAESKMTVAKQIVDGNCLSSEQIKEMAMQFDFEDDKLVFAKYAYSKCTDQNNYYKVNDVFDFDSSIEELNQHISSKR